MRHNFYMKQLWVLAGAAGVLGAMLWLGTLAYTDPTANPTPIATNGSSTEAWECDADGFICPDGSMVGRVGPTCEFAACPPANATSSTLTTYLGGSSTALQVTVNPLEVISDSRCPIDAQCVWAGTVEVRTVLSTEVSHGEHVMKLHEPQVFGDYVVTLIEVTPQPKAGEEIPVSSYRFTYKIEKR